jgi:hypothetical protein
MTMKNIIAFLIVSLMVASSAVPLSFDSSASDWDNSSGSISSPWVSDSPSPAPDDLENIQLRYLWDDVGTVGPSSDSSKWLTPSSAICVGEYTYYVDRTDDRYEIKKITTSTGTVSAKSSFSSDSMYNCHIAHGDGKIFAMVRSGTNISILGFSESDLSPAGISFGSVSGGDGTQNYLTYVGYSGNGYLMFGTYAGGFGCFNATTGAKIWEVSGNGFTNQIPVVVGQYCIFADNGYSAGGTSVGSKVRVHAIDSDTDYGFLQLGSDKHVLSSMASYGGRVYLACSDTGLTSLNVFSYTMTVNSGTASFTDQKTWTYSHTGSETTPRIGNQAGLTIVNDRIYLGGGGYVTGTDTYISVINIDSSGDMSTAYYIPIKEKGTISVTTGHSGKTYLYFVPFSCDSIYIAKDAAGQSQADYGAFDLGFKKSDYCFQSVTISSEGYLIVRTDSSLICLGDLDTSNGSPVIVGDVTGDGKFNYMDVLYMAQVNGQIREKTQEYDVFGDLNHDGKFNYMDVLFAAQVNGQIRLRLCPST